MNILVIVDMQNDFISGSLGTAEAQDILPAVIKKAEQFDGEIIFTRDTHGESYMQTQEGKNLPVLHCIEGTAGWELPGELEKIRLEKHCRTYDKPAFGSVELADDLKKKYEEGLLDSVELCGVCTDICVVSNALLIKAAVPELPVYLDAMCCAGTTPENHLAAVNTMKMCQIYVEENVNETE